MTALDDLRAATEKLDIAGTMRGYTLVVSPDRVEACRAAADTHGFTELAVVESSYLPTADTAYLFKDPPPLDASRLFKVTS